MNFSEAETYLFSLGNEVSAMKLGLENIRALLVALGSPQQKFLKVQVAGTNGKGSTCAFIDSIVRAAGIRTGLFTSPHLVSITERIQIDGQKIDEANFARRSTFVRDTAERLLATGGLAYRPTFFEQITAIALLEFAESRAELAILETGLGGRLDATTAAEAGIAVITRIDLDHQEYLGDTLEAVAREKAAIIGPSTRTAIIGPQIPEALRVIEDRINLINTQRVEGGGSKLESLFLEHSSRYEPDQIGLKGRHQAENAAIAVAAVKALTRHSPISDENIALGLVNARHPGRLEYQGHYLFDGAHNPGGARALAAYLNDLEPRPITIIFGAMEGKRVAEMAAVIFPKAEHVVLTRPENSRSAYLSDLVLAVPKEFEPSRLTLTENVGDAINAAEDLAGPDGLILVTGSLYLVGEVKRLLNN